MILETELEVVRWRFKDDCLQIDLGNNIILTVLLPDWVEKIKAINVTLEIDALGESNAQSGTTSVQ